MLSIVRNSTFLRHNSIVFVSSLVTGALNYIYYPVLGRLLQPAAFGEVQTLVSLFLQIVIFLSVMGLITVNIVANMEDGQESNTTIVELERLGFYISVALLLVAVGGGEWLRHYFHFASQIPFIMLALAVVISVPLTFRTGYLRGQKHFSSYAIADITSSAAKLVLSALFVLLGWGASGAILGLAISQGIALLIAARQAEQHGSPAASFRQLITPPHLRAILPELKYALLVLVGSVTITILYSIDIIVVKHFFDPHTAGLYAGVATIARIIYFLTGSMALVLMPSVKLRNDMRENSLVLLKSLALMIVLGGAVLLVFSLVPQLIIKYMMGSDYSPYAHLLPRLSLAIFVISVLNLLLAYNMSLRRYTSGLIALVGSVLTCVALATMHDSLQQIVSTLLYCSLLILATVGIWMGWMNRGLFIKMQRGNA